MQDDCVRNKQFFIASITHTTLLCAYFFIYAKVSLMILLDGKKLSLEIAENLKQSIETDGISPTLAIVQIGNVFESDAYIRHKKSFADKIGAKVLHVELPEDVLEKKIIDEIEVLNQNSEINGIIVQMPLPDNINKHTILESIDPSKDVDGLHSQNQAKIFQGDMSGIIPATPKGVMSLLKRYDIKIEGKKALVVGRSLLVGRPMAMLLLDANATVTIAHSKTKNLKDLVRENDIVIVAVGQAGLIDKDCVKPGQVIVDVGTNAIDGPKVLEEGVKRKLVGDVVFGEVSTIVDAISPVPGGVGPMTVASLFENLVEATKKTK